MKKIFMLPISMLVMAPAFAADPVNLMKQPMSFLHTLTVNQSNISMKETRRSVDFNNTVHVRMHQTYMGYPVWGADAVLHVPQANDQTVSLMSAAAHPGSSMNGIVYKNLNADLVKTPAKVFTSENADQALQVAVNDYQQKTGAKFNADNMAAKLMVYIDKSSKAHWAYKISFHVPAMKKGTPPSRPVYIIDAKSFHIYLNWNDIHTSIHAATLGGGFGGNGKMGKKIYDGDIKHFDALDISRDNSRRNCKLQNPAVVVRDRRTGNVMNYRCDSLSSTHNDVYWNGYLDAINGAYSPGNDALFNGKVIKQMYQDWYNHPVLVNDDGTNMLLKMYVHDEDVGDNAYWDPEYNIMVFGDGLDMCYPLTSIGIAAHEVSHGFTQQHSDLVYEGQSGGMNESYSDMAAKAAEMFAQGSLQYSWQIGKEVTKKGMGPFRYMDVPSKDCEGRRPGNDCSIDDASQYSDDLDVHYSSGVYNRFFYLLSTSAGWDVKKAFAVMVQANANYWTATTDFDRGACNVLQAATDLNMDLSAIKAAFTAVKVDYTDGGNCVVG